MKKQRKTVLWHLGEIMRMLGEILEKVKAKEAPPKIGDVPFIPPEGSPIWPPRPEIQPPEIPNPPGIGSGVVSVYGCNPQGTKISMRYGIFMRGKGPTQ